MKEDFFKDKLENNACIIAPNEGERFELPGVSLTFKVTSKHTNDQLGVYEIILHPGAVGAKLHYHRFMDETFIVNEGILSVQLGQKEYKANPGTVVYVPRFTPHGFRNDSDKVVKLILLFNPSQQREGFFRGLYETLSEEFIDPNKFLKLYNKYDSFPVDTSDMLPLKE